MLLSRYNIQELVTKQINAYLAKAELLFPDYKALILNKSPIPQIHSSLITKLNQTKEAEQVEVRKALEKNAFTSQSEIDKKRREQDSASSAKDEAQKEQVTNELSNLSTLKETYINKINRLRQRLIFLLQPAIKVQTTNHYPRINQKRTTITNVQKSLAQHEAKLQALDKRKRSEQKKLTEIEQRSKKRRLNQLKREQREQARIGYQITEDGVQATLSKNNNALLNKNIQEQNTLLNKRCAELIQESEKIHFVTFLKQVNNHITKAKKLAEPELIALRGITKLMQQHLSYQEQAETFEESLNKKRLTISQQKEKLATLKKSLGTLKDNPKLTKVNIGLIQQNAALATTSVENNNLYQKLGPPSLLLLALTFIFTIPLILTLNGIIPFFLTPVLMYVLFTSTPALLLAASVALGITAIVYSCKAHVNEGEIKTNRQTIVNNTTEMEKNHKKLHILLIDDIPNIESEIKKDEILITQLETTLQKTKEQAKHAVQQANELVPTPASNSPFLKQRKGTQELATSSKEKEDPYALSYY